ncbi:hypothetical protein CTAYLR_000420 [Chrysophaeum taylorii]|uniref:serine C-palmitoyltransferase n=1 Tax=Chrysophaeum taylorii TaxID=2483200 RepID=A0AAD7UIB9_9STRA|nr:hypothetical protein CTAYLR_000420 [Chrysophaeum taylorii]
MDSSKKKKTAKNGVHTNGHTYAPVMSEEALEVSQFTELTTYLGFAVLIVAGHLRDLYARLTGRSVWTTLKPQRNKKVAPLFKSWENFYYRRIFHRIGDVFDRPVCSSPGARLEVVMRERRGTDLVTTGETRELVNLGSYNYLGFADDWESTCGDTVLRAVEEWPISCGSSRSELGTTTLHRRLEQQMAAFVGKEDAIVFNMGYGTNSTTIPALVGKGDLILSDALNHASIVNGCRASGAFIRSFPHNDAGGLEAALREAIALGVPRTRRPWKKILVMVEGLYSMEGEICDLKAISAVCKKYKAYLYLDEAHSIGALGPTGRGACEHCGVSPDDVHVLMGTFTKSFGGMGGYIAASAQIIDHLRATCAGFVSHDAMSCVLCEQISTALTIVEKSDLGARKLRTLKDNSNFFRSELIKIGLHVYGDYDSPVIPVLLYNPAKIPAFSRECLARGLAVVVVGFPATPLVKGRARFCVSAGHTLQDLQDAAAKIKEVADILKIQYAISPFG